MTSTRQNRNRFLGINLRAETAALTLTIALVLTAFVSQSALAQTFQVIHDFTGGADGGNLYAGLTLDKAGNLYGTTYGGGDHSYGTVFRLRHSGSSWVFSSLDEFGGGGAIQPQAGVTIGPYGVVYGITQFGGSGGGAVFSLRPSPTACLAAPCPWTETTLYGFTEGGATGSSPVAKLVLDQAGNLYGTTVEGGSGCVMGCGVVFKLTPSGGGWTESVLYSFAGGADGAFPTAEVIFDNAGNLYSTTIGTFGDATVFQLTPTGGSWTKKTLYTFQGGSDGGGPHAGLIFDGSGNLYGATSGGGSGGGGTIFKLTPSNGKNWTFSVLYSFAGGGGPYSTLTMDAAGNLYGTTYGDGAYGYGSVFKLTPSNGGWTYNSLHDFTSYSDGGNPSSNVVFDAAGNLYGTAQSGGAYFWGTVWEITP